MAERRREGQADVAEAKPFISPLLFAVVGIGSFATAGAVGYVVGSRRIAAEFRRDGVRSLPPSEQLAKVGPALLLKTFAYGTVAAVVGVLGCTKLGMAAAGVTWDDVQAFGRDYRHQAARQRLERTSVSHKFHSEIRGRG
ncbi:unnamed protein product [Pedinophyceae sp. YPF-701]|nr:unnamed protein product [Pedinophyceae sp. YPF-701]